MKTNRLIFGIDNKNINPIDEKYIFTKSFRTLVNYSDCCNSQESVTQNIFDRSISMVNFFGHSLGEVDYSYFQQMFDCYDLYNNDNLKLYFYFKQYDSTRDIIEYLREQSRAVSSLIEKYGETMDNKSHGKNLLTRLEITKRLFIKQIE